MSSISLETIDSDAAAQSLLVLICNIFGWNVNVCILSISFLVGFNLPLLTRFHPWLVLTGRKWAIVDRSLQRNGYETTNRNIIYSSYARHQKRHLPNKAIGWERKEGNMNVCYRSWLWIHPHLFSRSPSNGARAFRPGAASSGQEVQETAHRMSDLGNLEL